MRWPWKHTFALAKRRSGRAVEQPLSTVATIYDPNCDDKEKYTTKSGDDYYDQTHTVDMDFQSKYGPPKQAHWLLRRIYILSWIRTYDRTKAFSDFIAGITLGLTIIPQSIAYAALADLSSEYGLYSAFIGSLIYVVFGTIPQVSIGPTSLMAIMTLQYCQGKPPQMVIVLAFLAGLVELLMGVFQLGFVVSFIPVPVTKAFTSGTAIIVILAQLKSLIGIKVSQVTKFTDFFTKINFADTQMGFVCICLLLTLRLLGQVQFKQNTPTNQLIKKVLWYISISRNALVVFFSGLLVYTWVQRASMADVPFALSANVASASLSIKLPPFAFEARNHTYVFTDTLQELGSGVFVVPIVAVLANVAIAKAFVADGKLDASQEMLTLGLCNLAGSFFSAMPTCGAFTRSAVSQASGVRTPMAGIYTGAIVLLALSVLTPYFQYIPKSSLAAVLVAAVIFMIDLKPIGVLWRSNKKDFFSWMGCFIICLVAGVELGLLFGILVSMICIVLRLGKPRIEVSLKKYELSHYIHVVPYTDVFYTGVDTLRSEILAACAMYHNEFPIVLDCGRFMQFDATFVEMLMAVAKELNGNNVVLVLQHMSLKNQQMLPVAGNIRYCNGDQDTLPLEAKQ